MTTPCTDVVLPPKRDSGGRANEDLGATLPSPAKAGGSGRGIISTRQATDRRSNALRRCSFESATPPSSSTSATSFGARAASPCRSGQTHST
jgi:hypothetical protein